MPYCVVSEDQNNSDAGEGDVHIFYSTFGRGPVKVLMIMGLACGHEAWRPQIEALAGTDIPNTKLRISECNRCHNRTISPCEVNSSPSATECSSSTKSSCDSVHSIPDGGMKGDECDGNGIEDRTWESQEVEWTGREVCVFDNRGVGRSSSPSSVNDYSTEIMAEDALCIADHLGWSRFHLVGHSMGAMIACKLAAAHPKRIASLALISTSNGGFDTIPTFRLSTISLYFRRFFASHPEHVAAADLDMHFSRRYLEERHAGSHRRLVLHKEYMRSLSKDGNEVSSHGLMGHVNAVWMHGMTEEEARIICSNRILTAVIHGRDDVIASVSLGQRLAARLSPVARFIPLNGGHMLIREAADEVNHHLCYLMEMADASLSATDWTHSHPCQASNSKELHLYIGSTKIVYESTAQKKPWRLCPLVDAFNCM